MASKAPNRSFFSTTWLPTRRPPAARSTSSAARSAMGHALGAGEGSNGAELARRPLLRGRRRGGEVGGVGVLEARRAAVDHVERRDRERYEVARQRLGRRELMPRPAGARRR